LPNREQSLAQYALTDGQLKAALRQDRIGFLIGALDQNAASDCRNLSHLLCCDVP
jgi:hypothetical protein